MSDIIFFFSIRFNLVSISFGIVGCVGNYKKNQILIDRSKEKLDETNFIYGMTTEHESGCVNVNTTPQISIEYYVALTKFSERESILFCFFFFLDLIRRSFSFYAHGECDDIDVRLQRTNLYVYIVDIGLMLLTLEY